MEWATSDEAGFTSTHMANRCIKYIDKVFEGWKPRKKYEFITNIDLEKQVLPHKLIY